MFIIEKIISLFIFSPMLYVLILLYAGIVTFGKRWKAGLVFLLSGVFLYLGSISPVVNFLGEGLERKEYEYEKIEPQAYVVLGGGSIESDMSVEPTRGALKRVVKGVELYNENPKPIYISGGKLFGSTESEAEIYKDLMIKLGVPSQDIIVEGESRNTLENAKFIKKNLERNVESIGLITSAIHMPRSMYTFKKELEGVNIIPFKCDFLHNKKDSFIHNYIPRYDNLMNSNSILWEYVGIVYYKIKMGF